MYRVVLFSIFVSAILHSQPVSAATSLSDTEGSRVLTSRGIVRSSRYLRAIERLELRQGRARKRVTPTYSNRSSTRELRDARARLAPRTDIYRLGRQNTRSSYRTPAFYGSKPSRISILPVTLQSQADYRNGVRYFLGKDVQQNLKKSYMWFSYALADGHPLAREAQRKIARRLSSSDMAKARQMTNYHSLDLLNFTDLRPEYIRDQERKQDMSQLMQALLAYKTLYGRYPGVVPVEKEKEICRQYASTCIERLNLKYLVPTFIVTIPVDPFEPISGNGTGYFVTQDKNGILYMYADHSELDLVVVTSEDVQN